MKAKYHGCFKRKIRRNYRASTGISYHLARVFAQNGFDLFVTAEEDKLAEAVVELEQLGTEVSSIQTDLATYSGVEELWRAVQATGRPVDAVAIMLAWESAASFLRLT